MAGRFVRRRIGAILSAARIKNPIEFSRRGVFDGYTVRTHDILLHRENLPEIHEDYLKVLDPETFREKFGIARKIPVYDTYPRYDNKNKKIATRWAIVLPLRIKTGGLIPIPFIVDTGVPNSVYFGTKVLQLLRELHVLEEVLSIEYPYVVRGALCFGEEELNPLFVCVVPPPHESEARGTLGHPCCNLLGLEAIHRLGEGLLTGYKNE